MDKLDNLRDFLESKNIPINDVLIVGSYLLETIGIRNSNDIDIILLDDVRARLNIPFDRATKINDHLEIVTSGWLRDFGINDDVLIQDDTFFNYYNGFKIIKVHYLILRKKRTLRRKDLCDLYLLRAITIKVIFKYLMKKAKSIFSRVYIYLSRKPINDLLEVTRTSIDPVVLLSMQYSNHQYQRYDLIVRIHRYLAIENKIHNVELASLYNIMQYKRTNIENYNFRFENLIEYVKNTPQTMVEPLTVYDNGILYDGSHRLAISIANKDDLIFIKSLRKPGRVDYSLSWFVKNGQSHEILNVLKDELFYSLGVYFPVIIWPTANHIYTEILKLISSEYAVIVDTFDVSLNEDEFSKFVRNVYKTDDVSDEKIESKILNMIQRDHFTLTSHIIIVEIAYPEFRRKHNDKLISKKVELIKKVVRKKFKNKISNYVHDLIIHIPDNFDMNLDIYNNLNDYGLNLESLGEKK